MTERQGLKEQVWQNVDTSLEGYSSLIDRLLDELPINKLRALVAEYDDEAVQD